MCFTFRFIFTQIELIFTWKFCTTARYETEAPDNSEMAFCDREDDQDLDKDVA